VPGDPKIGRFTAFFRVLIKPVASKELLTNVALALGSRGLKHSISQPGSRVQKEENQEWQVHSLLGDSGAFLQNDSLAKTFKSETFLDLALCLNHFSFNEVRLAKLSLHRLIGSLQYLGAASAEESARAIFEYIAESGDASLDIVDSFAKLAEQISDVFVIYGSDPGIEHRN